MRPLQMTLAVAALAILLSAAAPRAEAGGWRLVHVMSSPDHMEDTSSGHGWLAKGVADASEWEVKGSAKAFEYASFGTTSVTVVAVGTYFESWAFLKAGDKQVGEIELYATLDIEGEALLHDADCAAAALGFVHLKYQLDQTEIEASAELTKSIAETTRDHFGSVTIGFSGAHGPAAGVEIPLSVGSGEGRFPDTDQDLIAPLTLCPVQNLIIQTKTRSYMHAWADEFWGFDAWAEADMYGIIDSHVYRFGWPQCPDV